MLSSKKISVGTRKLRTKVTIEQVEDLASFHGFDFDGLLIKEKRIVSINKILSKINGCC